MSTIENNYFEIDGNPFDKDDIINLCKLQTQLVIHENIVASIEECANIWCNYSNDLSASWLYFPKNEEDILPIIKASSFFTSFQDYAK